MRGPANSKKHLLLSSEIQEDDERQEAEADLQEKIYTIFKQSRRNYGTRKIKKKLENQDKQVSRYRIGWIMRHLGIVSNYIITYYKPQKKLSNIAKVWRMC